MIDFIEQARLTDEQIFHVVGVRVLPEIAKQFRDIAQAQHEKDFNTPKEKPCPECNGFGLVFIKARYNETSENCPICEGIGKVSKTVKSILEDWIEE